MVTKRCEKSRAHRLGDARAVVLHGDYGRPITGWRGAQAYRALGSLRHGFDGVADQVEQRLLQQVGIGEDIPDARIAMEADRAVANRLPCVSG